MKIIINALFVLLVSTSTANAGLLDDIEKGLKNVEKKISDKFNDDKKTPEKSSEPEKTDAQTEAPVDEADAPSTQNSETEVSEDAPADQAPSVNQEEQLPAITAPAVTPSPAKKPSNKKPHYRSDKNWGINGWFAPFSLPFPMGWGVSAHYVANQNWLLEAEYFRSSYAINIFGFEVGGVTEQKYTLQARYFFSRSGSFNFIFGGGYRNLEVKLARDLFDLVTNDYSLTVTEMDAYFVKVGVANQWGWGKNKTVTVDWFSLEIPFQADVVQSASQYAENPDDQEEIEDAEHVLKWYPSGAIVKLSIGITF